MIIVLNLLVIFPALPHSGDSASADPPGRKQRFYFSVNGMYYNLPRRGTYVTQRELEFNSRIIETGTRIDAFFDLHSLSIGYMYEIIKQERASLGVFWNPLAKK